MLIDTMEQVSRPEFSAKPCDGAMLAGLCAQLALPASIPLRIPLQLAELNHSAATLIRRRSAAVAARSAPARATLIPHC